MRGKTQTCSTLSALLMGFATPQGSPALAAEAPVPELSPGMLSAMQRDLHLSERQVRQRLTLEGRVHAIEGGLRKAVKEGFGGAWMNPDATHLVVGMTRPGSRPTRVGRRPPGW